MSMTFDVPGGTATFRDPEDLTERGRRLVMTTIMPLQSLARKVPQALREAAEGKGPAAEEAKLEIERLGRETAVTRQEAAASMEIRDAVIVALLQSWTLDEPLPTIDNLLDLPGPLFRVLSKQVDPFVQAVLKATGPTNFEPGEKVPGSPFGGSSRSVSGSTARARRTRK
jgi:hypothetical protein